MHLEKWKDIKGLIKDKFEVTDEREEGELIGEDTNGDEAIEKKEIIEFIGPLGRMKLELMTRPIVMEKKTNFSRRIGGDVGVKYIYSDSEKTTKFQAFKWDDDRGDWLEIEAGMFE